MNRLFATLTVLVMAWGAGALASEHETQVAAWDQEKAAAAAGELATALDGLRTALRQEPSTGTRVVGGARERYRIRDRLRLMESESKHLAEELADGRGRDETLPVFERIDEIRRAAVDDARRIFLQQPVLDKIAAARAPLETLAGLYGVKLARQLEQPGQ